MNQTPPKSRFKCFFPVLPAGMWASALRNSTSWYRHVGLSCWSHTQHQGCLCRRSPHSGCHVPPEIIFLPVFWNFPFVQAVSCATQHIYRGFFFFFSSSWGYNKEAKMAVSQESTLWGGGSWLTGHRNESLLSNWMTHWPDAGCFPGVLLLGPCVLTVSVPSSSGLSAGIHKNSPSGSLKSTALRDTALNDSAVYNYLLNYQQVQSVCVCVWIIVLFSRADALVSLVILVRWEAAPPEGASCMYFFSYTLFFLAGCNMLSQH